MPPETHTLYCTSVRSTVEWLVQKLGPRMRVAAPLGLGKPNELLNLLYLRAKDDPALDLTLYTALSLNPPDSQPGLASAFLSPFRDRHWGRDYPILKYARDAERGKAPHNVRVHEFYFRAGSALRAPGLQRDYQCMNYTHVAASLKDAGVDVVVQLISKRTHQGVSRYSLSSNPDITLDLMDLYRTPPNGAMSERILMVGVVHPEMPFVGGDAEVPASFFDRIVDDPGALHRIFALPRSPIDATDHAIGFHASQLIPDDGTLQIGIGSLSDAVVSSLIFRHKHNETYREFAGFFGAGDSTSLPRETGRFNTGLYGLSEMVTDGFMHLRKAGILKREVIDERSGTRTYLHGAFFLGSNEFYEWLRSLSKTDFEGLRMTRVSKVNDLYDPHELLLRQQRKNPRFLNTCMQVTLLGAAASDTLEDGRVVSGVGGQYNFVAMSHELKSSRSILMLRSTRNEGGRRKSNLVWSHGHATIPRHLRDIVVTEYGVADLRGKTDQETIIALIEIADAEFQPKLIEIAKKHGKLRPDYKIPPSCRNSPERIADMVGRGRSLGLFAPFPFGSDFTPVEERLALALGYLKEKTSGPRIEAAKWFLGTPTPGVSDFSEEMSRMGLSSLAQCALRSRLERTLLLKALASTQ